MRAMPMAIRTITVALTTNELREGREGCCSAARAASDLATDVTDGRIVPRVEIHTGSGFRQSSRALRHLVRRGSSMAKDTKPVSIDRIPTELNKETGEQTEARERALDETLAETFPASAPLSSDPAPVAEDEA